MIKIGDIIEARIKSVFEYGIYLECDSQELFVDILEVAWVPAMPSLRKLALGNAIRVRVIGYDIARGRFCASIRRVDPRSNPYRTLESSGKLLERLRGVVLLVHPEHVQVEIAPGLIGYISGVRLDQTYRSGDIVCVRVSSLDAELGKMDVKVCNPE